jgi:hypothetical protein
MVDNSFARSTLPARAIKVGLFVLSHAEDFVLTQKGIARDIKMGARTVQDALVDLEEADLLVRIDVRDARGHRTGTRMHVSDVPFTTEERASLVADSATAESATAESASPKKTTSKQKTRKKEDQPSGGAASAAPEVASDQPEEEPVRRKNAKDEPALFDVEEPPAPPRAFGAGAVVATYVASYARHFAGARPGKSTMGQVSRAAKAMVESGDWSELELTTAADLLGATAFAGLERQAMMGRKSSRGPSKIIPHGDAAWSTPAAAQARMVEDDEFMSAWLAEQAGREQVTA